MEQLSSILSAALQYIVNAGGAPAVAWFDDDHAPIGRDLRRDLATRGLIEVTFDNLTGVRVITLTEQGKQAIQ